MAFLPSYDTMYEWFSGALNTLTDTYSFNPWRVPILNRLNIIKPDSGEALIPCNVAVISFPIIEPNIDNGAIVQVDAGVITEALTSGYWPNLNTQTGSYSVIQPDMNNGAGNGGLVRVVANNLGTKFVVVDGGSDYVTGPAFVVDSSTGNQYQVFIGVNSQQNKDLDKVALPNLTTEEAGANGDVRRVYFAIIDQLAQAYLEKRSTDRPTRMVVSKATTVASATGILTTTYSFQFQLYSTGLEVVNEVSGTSQ